MTTRDCLIELTRAMMYFSFGLGLWIHPISFTIGDIKYFTIFPQFLSGMSFIGVIGGFVWVMLCKSQFSAFVNNSTFLIDQSQLLGLKMNKNNGRTKLLWSKTFGDLKWTLRKKGLK